MKREAIPACWAPTLGRDSANNTNLTELSVGDNRIYFLQSGVGGLGQEEREALHKHTRVVCRCNKCHSLPVFERGSSERPWECKITLGV